MPQQEEDRLKAVDRFLNLDFSHEKELQDIAFLASEICQTPVALITLLDDNHQTFLFKIGTDITGTDRQISFCNYTIEQNSVLVIPDMTADSRFTENPLVTGDTNVRFYAGSPLTTHDGQKIGSLCVIDQKPKILTEKQQQMLQILAKQAINLMELQLSVKLLNESVSEIEAQKKEIALSENKLRSFIESFDSLHLLLTPALKIVAHNNALSLFIKEIRGVDIQIGDKITDYMTENYKAVFMTNFNRALSGEPVEVEVELDYGKTGKIWWQHNFYPAFDSNFNIIGVSHTSKNINERKLNEQKILSQYDALKEIAQIQSHHFRRPVATILGLMDLIRDDKKSRKECLVLLEDAVKELDDKIHDITNYTQLSEVRPD
jgi:hypothetical protein